MLRRLSLIAMAGLAIAAACGGDGGDDDESTPTEAAATATSDPGETPTIDSSIRTLDLESNEDVAAIVADAGGSLVQSSVLYADLTRDGVEEAIVPVSSGGTLGDVAFVVLTPDGGGAKTLLKEQPEATMGLALDVDADGDLIVTEPVPGPDDPECCPSMLRRTTYSWNGAALALESVETVPNPDAGAKGTPQPSR